MDLADLYRDVIVDHNRSPRNRGLHLPRARDFCRAAAMTTATTPSGMNSAEATAQVTVRTWFHSIHSRR